MMMGPHRSEKTSTDQRGRPRGDPASWLMAFVMGLAILVSIIVIRRPS
jgi:hypothetical protein